MKVGNYFNIESNNDEFIINSTDVMRFWDMRWIKCKQVSVALLFKVFSVCEQTDKTSKYDKKPRTGIQ